jgi:hypothetical protein
MLRVLVRTAAALHIRPVVIDTTETGGNSEPPPEGPTEADMQKTRSRRRPAPPLVPEEFALISERRTKYQGSRVDFEVYGRRRFNDAQIRLIDNAGSMDAGAVVDGGSARAIVQWTDEARDEYDDVWLAEQAATIKQELAERWKTS